MAGGGLRDYRLRNYWNIPYLGVAQGEAVEEIRLVRSGNLRGASWRSFDYGCYARWKYSGMIFSGRLRIGRLPPPLYRLMLLVEGEVVGVVSSPPLARSWGLRRWEVSRRYP